MFQFLQAAFDTKGNRFSSFAPIRKMNFVRPLVDGELGFRVRRFMFMQV